jgi:hypothetical protein
MPCSMSFVHFLGNCYNISTRIQKNSAVALNLPFLYDKCNEVTVPLRNLLLFVVTSIDFVTFKISVTSNCYGTVARKNG